MQGKVGPYVNYAIMLLEQRGAPFVALKGMGRAMVKVSHRLKASIGLFQSA